MNRLIWICNTEPDKCDAMDFKGTVVIGNPRPTETYSQEELVEMNLVGKYVPESYASQCVIIVDMIKDILK